MDKSNTLDYSISLREKGLGSEDIKKKLQEKGIEDSKIEYYLRKSDEIFLDQSINYRKSKSKKKYRKGIKTITLVLSLVLLISVIYGYVKIGLLGIFILWSLIGYSSYRN